MLPHFEGGDGMYVTLVENGIILGYIGSIAGNPDDVDFGTFGEFNTNSAVHLSTRHEPRLTVRNNGNVGIGTTEPNAKFVVNGFAKLGTNAPAIKMKKLTGTTSATQGTPTNIVHGLNSTKFLAVNVLVKYDDAGNFVPSSYNSYAGYEFDYYITPTLIVVRPKTGNSTLILSKQIVILVTYEE